MAQPRVAVVVATYGRAARLPRLVGALEAQTLAHDEFEVWIVQDGDCDGTTGVLEELRSRSSIALNTLRLEPNRGPAWARNAGWRSSSAPILAFTDDDCIPAPDWLAEGVRVMEADPTTGIVQGETRPEPGPPLDGWVATRTVTAPSPFFEGCNLFIRRDAIEAAGGFDEELGLHCEDTALGWEIVDRGWERGFAPLALVHHDVTRPGLRWFLTKAAREGHFAKVARDHPAIRDELWRRWCFNRDHALAALALISGAVGLWSRPALAGALPYLAARWPGSVSRAGARHLAWHAAVDATTVASMIRGSWRWRTFLL